MPRRRRRRASCGWANAYTTQHGRYDRGVYGRFGGSVYSDIIRRRFIIIIISVCVVVCCDVYMLNIQTEHILRHSLG